jgi:hypothetical protein
VNNKTLTVISLRFVPGIIEESSINMAFGTRMIRRLFCKHYDPDCPNLDDLINDDDQQQLDDFDTTNANDDFVDDNIDFVEEDPSGGTDGLPPCSVDPDTGAFGSTGSGGDEDFVETVVFQYQVQTVVNLTASDFAFHKLPLIERALSDLLVPDLFLGSDCENDAEGRHHRRVRSRQGTRMLHIVPAVDPERRFLVENLPLGASDLNGLDTKPNDSIAPGLDGGTWQSDCPCLCLPYFGVI